MSAVAIWATARALPNTPQNDPEIVEVILNSMLNVVSSDDFSHLLRARHFNQEAPLLSCRNLAQANQRSTS